MPAPNGMTLNAYTTSASLLDIPQHNELLANTSSANELLHITNPSEELLSPAGHYAMGTVLATIAVLGLVQNSTTLVALNKRQSPQQIEILIKVLLVADLFMCVLSLPFAVTSSFAGQWLFGPIGCNWYGFSMFFLGVFSINILTAICIERYCTMRQIMQVPASAKSRLLAMSLVVSTLGALFWSILPLLGVSSYQLEGVGTSCSVDWKSKKPQDQAYFVVILICGFILPLIAIITCYSQIYKQISSRPWSTQLMNQSHLSQRRIKMEIHLARTMFLAAGSFVAAWSPYAVVALVTMLTDPDVIPPIVFSIPAIFAKSSVFGNSLVYVFMNRDLRLACLQTLRCKRRSVGGEEIVALPNEQQRVKPCVIAHRLEPRDACFQMNNLRPNVSSKGSSKSTPQFVYHNSMVSSKANGGSSLDTEIV